MSTALSRAKSNGGAASWKKPAADERTPIKLPANIDLDDIPKYRTLSDMLASGDLDGLNGAPNVDRLFPDYPKVEEAYFRKTRIFPIMHTIGIRRSLIEKYPWLATSVYKAFLKAKDLACTS
jgi:4,5-dihydroxyphthalate decarboxylase